MSFGGVAAAVFGWLRRGENRGQTLVGLALGLLLMMLAVFSAMRGGEEDHKGELRTKTLIYDAGPDDRIGLYWMDDKENIMRKATSAELGRCEELHPNEGIPICQTTYYEEDGKEQ